MKKVLIALLAVLFLVSFTSCDTQKKIDDAVAEAEAKAAAKETATADFVETFNANMSYTYFLQEEFVGSYDLSKFDSTEDADKDAKTAANNMIQSLIYCAGHSDTWENSSLADRKASGTVNITKEEDGTIVLNAKDVKISWKRDGKSYSVSLNGEIKDKETENKTENTSTYEYEVVSLTKDGTTYKPITATIYTEKEQETKLTYAVCNGIELNCDIVKAVIDK